ncbi:Xaa-Pro peptidase family protein [Corynebacterium sp. sy039]|uniref:M24 family metallopeptidase n=1 Tax=Corynebacterium sp. sy039 TaxID=2599641 RepID=UPI0011B38009|nr:Xaa-Pro peptidase family protein [Corynebacterium sp. sy039]QDZ42597.1 aminopeptidase P family protein [Corynebacterium sp. sy039]
MTEQKCFPAHVYQERLNKAQEICRHKHVDGLIISSGSQFAYLLGTYMHTHERFCALIIPASGQPALILPDVDKAELAKGVVGALDIKLTGWQDGENAYALALSVLAAQHDSGDGELRRIGVGPDLTADHFLKIRTHLPHAEYVLATTLLAELFVQKDEEEIAQLRRAAQAIDAVHAQVPALLVAGRTEAEVAAQLHELIACEHEHIDFVIVGSAENGANPHHDYSQRVLATGDVVVVDIGGTTDFGYHSDCTRTYVVGGSETVDAEVARRYAILQKAQAAALAAVAPGVSAHSIDQAARDIIAEAGFADNFIHRTGHGIGLSVHEEPYIIAGNELILQPGMCFSVEPGIYFPGEFGARIEDIVVVTETGCETLNNQPRGLQ